MSIKLPEGYELTDVTNEDWLPAYDYVAHPLNHDDSGILFNNEEVWLVHHRTLDTWHICDKDRYVIEQYDDVVVAIVALRISR